MLATWVVFLFGSTTFAFQTDSLSNERYLIPLDQYSYLRPQFNARATHFNLQDAGKIGGSQNYFLPGYKSVGVAAHFFNMGMAFNTSLNKEPGRKRGFDFQTTWLSSRGGIDFFAQRQHDVKTDFSNLPLQTASWSLNGYYIFNHRRFSLSPLINQTVKQNRSAGSFVILSRIGSLKSKGDSTLVVPNNKPYYGNVAEMKGVRVFSWGLMPGYAYTYTRGNWFATGAINWGPAHYWQKYFMDAGNFRNLDFGLASALKLHLGYDKDRFFAGMQYQWLFNRYKSEEVLFKSGQHIFRFFLGVRILESGLWTKSVDELFSTK